MSQEPWKFAIGKPNSEISGEPSVTLEGISSRAKNQTRTYAEVHSVI